MGNVVKDFFHACSGADPGILGREECHVESNKYVGIGATILSTAVLASASGGYAFYTVFDSAPLAVCAGLTWGAIIFNLDRYIVSTIRKRSVPDNPTPQRLFLWGLGEGARFAPRLLLAVFIAVLITRPLELKIFESEINDELDRQFSRGMVERQEQIRAEFPRIQALTGENERLRREVETKQADTRGLYDVMMAECTGEKRVGTTGVEGRGPFCQERKEAYERSEEELRALTMANETRAAANETELAALRVRQDERVRESERLAKRARGLLARLKALSSLAREDTTVALTSWFLIFLFIFLETAPILFKMISARGPYDEIYEAHEYRVRATEQRSLAELANELDMEAAFNERLHAAMLTAALQLNRRTMEALENLAPADIRKAQAEIARQAVNRWKSAELESLRYEPAGSAPPNGAGRPTPSAPESAREVASDRPLPSQFTKEE
jgi:hypothetical protein